MSNTELATISSVGTWTLEQVQALGTMLAKSGYFKDVRDASQAVVKILYGQELGISPIAAMRGIFIDERGNISLSAGIVSAKILSSKKYSYRVVQAGADVCEIDFLQDGKVIGTSKLTIQEARGSNMHLRWDKDGKEWKEKTTWKYYQSDMLFARAITRGARRFTPDIFIGSVYVPDEMDEKPDIEVYEMPRAELPQPSTTIEAPQLPESVPTTLPEEVKTRQAVAKCIIKTGKWQAIAESLPAYYGHVRHALNALAAAGYSEVTDANLAEVSQFLLDHAVKKAAEQDTAQA